MTPELCAEMYRENKLVGVWLDSVNSYEENYSYYEMIYDSHAVMFTTDFPY